MRILPLWVALLLAGCSASPDEPAPAPASSPSFDQRDLEVRGSQVTAVHLQHCLEYGATYPYPSSRFSVPDGFEVRETSPGVTFVLEVVYECQSGNASVAEQYFMVPVVPPDTFADPTARFQVMFLGATSQGAADLYAAWGFADVVLDGTVSIIPASMVDPRHQWAGASSTMLSDTSASITEQSTVGSAGHALVFHPQEPERAIRVAWSGYEEARDGGAAVTQIQGLPGVVDGVLQGTPFSRAGSAYHWTIEPVRPGT